jgi:hypothetical protein
MKTILKIVPFAIDTKNKLGTHFITETENYKILIKW